MSKTYYVIPARKGSKGLPGKNRRLFLSTFQTIPESEYENTILTTDDEVIKDIGSALNIVDRSDELSNDTANMKDVLLNVIEEKDIKPDDIMVLLYLTYPERTWQHVYDALKALSETEAHSLLCKKTPEVHPCLCFFADGSQVIEHNLYRRQDYPDIFELSHFIQIAYAGEIPNLSKNLFNANTFWYDIGEGFTDVDEQKDLEKVGFIGDYVI